ncbi:protein kinase domain-containing protein [Ophiostoma piceae UAMH 11346]|uniref:non-specific serine/threonine protein kinase n=1 Tax=Ophiostoma piceae (strain UAMH 11346) TaxID=1262450 RepID=S3C7F3_OPHP1|nr:protein kinase domain-containing protein [Ophiostoma piceae UAMH 11346]
MATKKDTTKKTETTEPAEPAEPAEPSRYPTYCDAFEAENPNRYGPGGYHVVRIGDVLHEHYRIVTKLGYGGYTTIWLAHDSRVSRYVALKISMAGHAEGKPEKEIEALRDLQSDQPDQSHQSDQQGQSYDGRHLLLNVLDAFHVTGPNGTHCCYTMVPAHGPVGFWLDGSLIQLPLARALAGGLVRAVAYMHRRGYVHGDLALRNILKLYPLNDGYIHHLTVDQFYEQYGQPDTEPVLRWDEQPLASGDGGSRHVPDELVQSFFAYGNSIGQDLTLADMRIQLCDFGEAYKPRTTTRVGRDCGTPWPLRPIEAHFMPDAPLSFPADIWTLGMVLWDTVAMQRFASSDHVSEEETISQLIDAFGPLPAEWQGPESWRAFAAARYDAHGKLRSANYFSSLDEAFDKGVQAFRASHNVGVFSDDERAAFLDLIRRMMAYRPEDRLTIEGVLQSEWMQTWALPAFAEAEAVQAKETKEAKEAKETST